MHRQIDALIAAGLAGQPLAPRAEDAEFVRRIFLDLTGRIPSAAQATAFLENPSPDKRAALIDQLLESPEHARRLQQVFDELLMRRQPSKHVTQEQWRQYLFDAFRKNRSWRELTVELLTADGVDPQARPAARFLLDRELKTEETVRDVGRIFLGRDLQCAQCHDHPQIDGYLQRHFYGLAAFLNRSYLFKDPKLKVSVIGEKAEGVVKFTSVFTQEEGETAPRVLDAPPIVEPAAAAADLYEVKPGKTTRGVPKFSRRLQLAKSITDPDNRAFRRNIANRVWALLMGRGIVEPVDMFHEANPPSHPELLDRLADDLHRHDYDLRHMIREIVLSETYQRTSRAAPLEPEAPPNYAQTFLKPLSPEQLAWSTLQAVGKVDAVRDAAIAVERRKPPEKRLAAEPEAFAVEQSVEAQLRSAVASYTGVFVSANESSRFDATAQQALFLLNGAVLSDWLAQSPTIQELAAEADALQSTQSLFWAVLTRPPSEPEMAAAAQLLEALPEDRATALAELARAMLCSAEFRFNH